MSGRGIRQVVLSGLVVVAALVTVDGTRVAACSCFDSLAPCESVWDADAVFVGTVARLGATVEYDRDAGVSSQPARVTIRERVVHFEVTEAFRGVEVGALEARTSTSSCGYDFMAGRTYVVYAHKNPSTAALTVSLCSRTVPVARATEDLAYLHGAMQQPAETAVVRGQALRDKTPFAGARVSLEGYTQRYVAITDDDGRFEVRVPVGDYTASVEFRDGVYGSIQAAVRLPDPRACAVRNIWVRSDGRLTGRLMDASGAPVPFGSVLLRAPDPSEPSAAPATWRAAGQVVVSTGPDGRFEFTRLEAGRYAVALTPSVFPEGNVPWPLVLEQEGRIDLGDLRAPADLRFVQMTGTVAMPDGSTPEGIRVYANPRSRDGSDGSGAHMVPDEDGRFAITVLAGREYTVGAFWRQAGPPLVVWEARSDSVVPHDTMVPLRLVLR